jgi:hypothetical protein
MSGQSLNCQFDNASFKIFFSTETKPMTFMRNIENSVVELMVSQEPQHRLLKTSKINYDCPLRI